MLVAEVAKYVSGELVDRNGLGCRGCKVNMWNISRRNGVGH